MTLDRDVVARLEQLAPTYPWECLAIVNSWLKHSPNYWDLSFNRSNLSAIVATGATSDDDAARSLAREVASNLALAGLYLGGNRHTDAK